MVASYFIKHVNFIGLNYNVLLLLNEILIKFKEDNKDNKKIECLLPDNLNQLIEENKMNMKYFQIQNKIIGLTNPEDELIVKNILKSINWILKLLDLYVLIIYI